MKINDIHRFYININSTQYYDEVQEIARGIQMDDILYLDISSSLPYNDFHNSFPSTFSKILPNLREIDLSSTILFNGALLSFSMNCPLLEKVSWNDNIGYASKIDVSGVDMRASRNLKEIHMNDYDFQCSSEQMSNLNNPAFNNCFIFHDCCRTLERVSIRNGNWSIRMNAIIPQNALIKFVCNVSSLRWFRSDLTQENIKCFKGNDPESNF
jgi:hypothetical protein